MSEVSRREVTGLGTPILSLFRPFLNCHIKQVVHNSRPINEWGSILLYAQIYAKNLTESSQELICVNKSTDCPVANELVKTENQANNLA